MTAIGVQSRVSVVTAIGVQSRVSVVTAIGVQGSGVWGDAWGGE